jgi:hypothetical protein
LLLFEELLPTSNLEHLLLDELFLSSFLKPLSKRIHKLYVEAQLPSSEASF